MYRPAADHLGFSTGGSEAMRLDSSGNLLVGKTSQSDGATAGHEFLSDGRFYHTKSGDHVGRLNRLSTNGDILRFAKDGSTVGSIGVEGGDLVIGTGTNCGLQFNDGNAAIRPFNIASNAAVDNAVDLGISSSRFKDLYLSGGVYLGGTGAANKLDDYEEGTFTPTLVGSTSGAFTTDVTDGIYTKVGRVVTVHVSVSATAVNTAVGSVIVGNLPFTVKSYVGGSKVEASGSVGYWSNLAAAKNNLTVFGAEATTNVEVYALGSATGSAPTQVSVADFGTTGNLLFTLTYFTDA